MLFKRKQEISNLRISQNHKGVTLVEVIAVIAVLSVVMAAVTGFVLTGTKMSAQVSGTATMSAREQTAVEFIYKTLQSTQAELVADGEAIQEGAEEVLYPTLSKKNENGDSVPMIYQDENGKVVYRNGSKVVELCSGEIYFKEIATNTVTYYLNGTKHVVHLRTV